jgi:hypothetical protein
MARAAAPNVDWHLLTLEQLEQHARDLKAISKNPTSRFTAALRKARQDAANQLAERAQDVIDQAVSEGKLPG